MFYKKLIKIFFNSFLLLVILTGCTNSSQCIDKKISINNNVENSPIEADDIEFVGLEILQPDSIGKRYIKTKVKNNSDLPITSIRVELKIGDKETTYIVSNKKINPKETSEYIKCFGPKSGNLNDIEAQNINIKANKDGKIVFIDYNTKLDEYNVLEANIGSK